MTEALVLLGCLTLFAAAGIRLGSMDRAGAIAGWVLGIPIVLAWSWPGFSLLAGFVVAGSAASRCFQPGFRRNGRSSRHAIANIMVASLLSGVACFFGGDLLAAPFAGALAAALADTLSSEVGICSSSPPRLILSGRVVPPGTDGGVTILGTAAGLAGACAIGIAGVGMNLFEYRAGLFVVLAGLTGTLVDSFIGALLEREGCLNNEHVNFLATLAGAAVAGVSLLPTGAP